MSQIDSKLLIDSAPDAILVADSQGVIRVWNHAAERMFGYSADQALGQTLDLIVPERFRERHWAAFHAAVESGRFGDPEPGPRPSRAALASGDTMVVDLAAELIRDRSGAVIAVMGSMRAR